MDSLVLGESPVWLPFEYLCAHCGDLAKPREGVRSQEQRTPVRRHQRCEGSPVHEWGVYHPFLFCALLFYSLEFMQGFHLALPCFPHITCSPGSEGFKKRCLAKPCTWLWGTLHSRLSQLKND